MTGAPAHTNGTPRRRPGKPPEPPSRMEVMRPSKAFQDRSVEEIARTAHWWAVAAAAASKRASNGVIGGRKRGTD